MGRKDKSGTGIGRSIQGVGRVVQSAGDAVVGTGKWVEDREKQGVRKEERKGLFSSKKNK